ncbi:type I polyketide synthase, partial [Amycolatopsis sp. SID8362]|uniref:type I polyketide synthase n=1 Tax=Amycolatopsis sp. SID8362 TaxID=2690346 RepID=UPI00136E8C6E
RWLAEQGAGHVVLTSRRGPDAPGVAELVAELAERGTTVTVAACDVSDRDALADLLAGLKADGRTVRTVIHAAAFIGLETLARTGLAEFGEVVRAKVAGAAHLDELLDDEELDAFVLYSSVAGMWGSGLHGAYSAANAYLAALTEQRRARGARATTIAWGMWDSVEGATGSDGADQITRSGLVFMDTHRALTGLRRALDDDDTVLAIADIDWDRYLPVFTSVRRSAFLGDLPEARRLAEAAEKPAAAAGEHEFVRRIRALGRADQERTLLELVRAEAATALGHVSADAVEEERAFRDVGFDSLTAVELRNRLATVTGLSLPSTMVFDYPNPLVLAGFLQEEIVGAAEAVAGPVSAAGAHDEPIAIVGMSCRFPGGVRTPGELWALLAAGGDAISGFPDDRGWDAEAIFDPDPDAPGKAYSTQGGFLDGAGNFDPAFFGISPREAFAMDPQQRVLLEAAWEVFEGAGIDPAALRGTPTGTFIGSSYQDYDSVVVNSSDGGEGRAVTGNLTSVLSGRVAYTFGLEGPAVTVDTACSSSLVALHLACQSLRDGESSLALAGGVTVMPTSDPWVVFSAQGMLAKDGRCKAFAESADG